MPKQPDERQTFTCTYCPNTWLAYSSKRGLCVRCTRRRNALMERVRYKQKKDERMGQLRDKIYALSDDDLELVAGVSGRIYHVKTYPGYEETMAMKPNKCDKCGADGNTLSTELIGEYRDGRDIGFACFICGKRFMPNIQAKFERRCTP